MQDTDYRDFNSALIPTVDKKLVIGIRTPVLRKFAKEYGKTNEAQAFLSELPHTYFEENNLHAFLIEQISDYSEAVRRLNEFLPFVDNWATCDSMNPRVFAKNTDRLICEIHRLLAEEHTYAKRYAVGLLMRYYLDEHFKTEYLDTVSAVRSDEYYVNMMIAWYFATALAKQYDSAVAYIENRRLDIFTHNKAIQKAVESKRISAEQKAYLKSLKIKY